MEAMQVTPLRIDQHFSEELLQGKRRPLQVILDGRPSNTAANATNYLRQVVLDYNHSWLTSPRAKSSLVILSLQTRT
jgi:hypothetical protein